MSSLVRILLIGDIVGKPGRQIVLRAVPGLKIAEKLDLVVANAENAAGGSGLTPEIFQELTAGGVDCITMGDHIYRRREIYAVLDHDARIVKPANYPPEAPGRTFTVLHTASQVPVAVFNLLGRVFMPPVDCPFQAADRVLASLPADVRVILVDFHAEATSDKQLMGRILDGRVSAALESAELAEQLMAALRAVSSERERADMLGWIAGLALAVSFGFMVFGYLQNA